MTRSVYTVCEFQKLKLASVSSVRSVGTTYKGQSDFSIEKHMGINDKLCKRR